MEKISEAGRLFALDLGSKNFKLVSGEIVGGHLQVHLEGKRTLELGKAVEANHGVIGDAKLAEIEQALIEFVARSESNLTERLMAIGTGALRIAENRHQVVALAQRLGIDLVITSGEREGQLSYLAATGGEPGQLVSDLGSESLQLSWADGSRIQALSQPLGYRVLYKDYLNSRQSLAEFASHAVMIFSERLAAAPQRVEKLIAVGANTAVSWATGESKESVRGSIVKHEVLKRSLQEPDSVDTVDASWEKILPGLILLDFLLDYTGLTQATVAEVELPVGLLVEYFGKSAPLRYTVRPPEWV